jgi:LmbE family N-acetylglucosaminyl deacetylase
MPDAQRSTRIVVVAPHPDDESLGAAGTMARARDEHAEVRVLFMTSGDGFRQDAARYYLSLDVGPEEYLHLGYERQEEARRALAELGVGREQVAFLGLPDGGLDVLWRQAWSGQPWTSPTTGADRVPYWTAWRPDLPYCGADAVALLTEWFRAWTPDIVIMPSAFDRHPDHWATNALVSAALLQLPQGARIARWGYLVHWPRWPLPLVYRPQKPMRYPRWLERQRPLKVVPLTDAQRDHKRQALLCYESQVELIKPFMMAFVRSTEVFLPEAVVSQTRAGDRYQLWTEPASGAHPVRAVVFERTEGAHQFTLALARPAPPTMTVELTLHVASLPSGHGTWQFGSSGASLPVGWTVDRAERQWRLRWPVSWYRGQSLVMAGIQIFQGGRWAGQFPVTVMEVGA